MFMQRHVPLEVMGVAVRRLFPLPGPVILRSMIRIAIASVDVVLLTLIAQSLVFPPQVLRLIVKAGKPAPHQLVSVTVTPINDATVKGPVV